MNDEELDHLFRQAAERHAQRASGKDDLTEKAVLWNKIESQLQKPTGTTSTGLRKRRYLLILLLAAVGLSVWLLVGRRDRVADFAATEEFSAQKPEAPVAPASPYQTDHAGKASKDPAVQTSQSGHHANSQGAGTYNSQTSTHTPPMHGQMKEPLVGNHDIAQESQTGLLGHLRQATQHQPIGPISQGRRGWVSSPVRAAVSMPDHISGVPDPSHLFKPEETISSSEMEIDSGSIARHKKEKSQSKNSPPVPHWQLGFTIGPDWNSASGHGWRTGVGGGLKLSYRLNHKWAISSGILVDKKLYDARPNDYNPPDNNWRNYDVKSIDANCTVIEVPINIDYSLWQSSRSRIFISGGVSSLWMHKEKYTYRYKTSGGEWGQWSKKLRDQNHNVFSVINLAPGYEHRFQRMSVQVAPYIKVPVSGIGYGKVNLYSTGVHFTLQYGLK